MKTTTTKTTANEMRFIGPSSHLAEEHPVDMVALNLTNRSRKEAGPLGGLREQYENVRGKVGELEHIGNLGNWVKIENGYFNNVQNLCMKISLDFLII